MPDTDDGKEAKREANEAPPARRRTRGVMPEPSEASRGRPVPKPVKPKAPAPSTSSGRTSASSGEPRPDGTPRPAGTTASPGRSGPGKTTRRIVSKTTRPGLTQASSGGGGTGAGGGFVTQRIRDEDRVNVNMDVNVQYRFVAAGDPDQERPGSTGRFPTTFRGRLVDISMGGAQVEGPIAPEVGRDELKRGAVTVEAVFELPFVERPLEIAVRVNWIKPSTPPRSCLGFRFQKPTAEQQRIIRAFLIGLQSPTRTKFRRGR